MKVITNSEQPSVTGPESWFTGRVRLDGLFSCPAPAQASAGFVTFEPGARTAWHVHPAGQLLCITAGEGWIQKEGEERITMRPGDTVWIEAGEKHWHGASAEKAMTHLAITESLDGSAVTWLEHVEDKDYLG